VAREKINENENELVFSGDSVPSTGVKKPSVGDPLHAWQWGQSLCGGTRIRYSQRDAVVKQVQLALRQRGYYAHAIDGFMGAYTQEAIQDLRLIIACEQRR